MKRRTDKVEIISELHPQHGGDIKCIETMILQSKMAGADYVKLQLYTSLTLFGDGRKQYAEVNSHELKHLKEFALGHGIELFGSVFDTSQVDVCETLGINAYKIASKRFGNEELCYKVIDTQKTVFVSNGFNPDDFRYESDNVKYMYCIPEYPTYLEDVCLPDFTSSRYEGYSDHTTGLTAAMAAVVKGAKYIEKHFTLSKNLQSTSERGHLGGMDFDDLFRLRKFCDEFVLMK